jgi:hypothetical protein
MAPRRRPGYILEALSIGPSEVLVSALIAVLLFAPTFGRYGRKLGVAVRRAAALQEKPGAQQLRTLLPGNGPWRLLLRASDVAQKVVRTVGGGRSKSN